MLELFNKIPISVQAILLVAFVLVFIPTIGYLLLALRDTIDESKKDRERERRERQKLYDSVLRIARVCESIVDILATTELLSTVEVTEEGLCHMAKSVGGG